MTNNLLTLDLGLGACVTLTFIIILLTLVLVSSWAARVTRGGNTKDDG